MDNIGLFNKTREMYIAHTNIMFYLLLPNIITCGDIITELKYLTKPLIKSIHLI